MVARASLAHLSQGRPETQMLVQRFYAVDQLLPLLLLQRVVPLQLREQFGRLFDLRDVHHGLLSSPRIREIGYLTWHW